MKKRNKRDYLSYTLFFQFTVCLILFGTLFGLKEINSDIYLSVKNDFQGNLNSNFEFVESSKEKAASVISSTEINKTVLETANINQNITKEEEKSNDKPINNNSNNKLNDELNVKVSEKKNEDYGVNSETAIPDNVSVNSYTLTKRMVMPVNGEVTSSFGMRNHPISGNIKFHAGIDIAADTGTPIYSAFDGEVTVVKFDEWNGNYLKITHDSNITTVYCHCDELIVKEGDKVKAGDVVGYVGSTGSSTGPHLHFEIRVKNISYDPQTALNEAVNAI